MTSASQFAANQSNAQSSTGPRTEQGKAASSQNSACHGLTSEFAILSHENAADFNDLSTEIVQEIQPTGIHEKFLVERMVEGRWRASRCQRLEHAAMEAMLNPDPDPDPANLSPDARIVLKMQGRGDVIALLLRYRTSALAQYDKAYRELIQGRKRQFKHEQEALDHYIKNVVYAPMPGETAPAEQASAQSKPAAPPAPNGFVSHSAPPVPDTSPETPPVTPAPNRAEPSAPRNPETRPPQG